MSCRMLVAGVGNIFFGDDGFGVEVARRLSAETLPAWVRVEDYGIRSLHLAYELAGGGYDATVLVDAAARGGEPGTVYLIEPETEVPAGTAQMDAHGISPDAVFAAVRALGGSPGRVWVVGCEPAETGEGIGLSRPVMQAVGEAVRMVHQLIERQGS